MTTQPTPFSSILYSDTPESKTHRELHREYYMTPRTSVGVFDKIGLALANETVTGQFFKNFGGTDYRATPGYEVTEDVIGC